MRNLLQWMKLICIPGIDRAIHSTQNSRDTYRCWADLNSAGQLQEGVVHRGARKNDEWGTLFSDPKTCLFGPLNNAKTEVPVWGWKSMFPWRIYGPSWTHGVYFSLVGLLGGHQTNRWSYVQSDPSACSEPTPTITFSEPQDPSLCSSRARKFLGEHEANARNARQRLKKPSGPWSMALAPNGCTDMGFNAFPC